MREQGHGQAILIVEDDDDVREVLAEILGDEGYETPAAVNGVQALEVLRKRSEPPALILLDLMMPVMDGWRFLEERARDPALSQIPVVVMSATPQHLKSFTGAAAFLRKPINFDELLGTIERWARKSDTGPSSPPGAADPSSGASAADKAGA